MTVGELLNFSLFHCAICKMGAITTSISYDTQALRIVFSIKSILYKGLLSFSKKGICDGQLRQMLEDHWETGEWR